MSLQPFYKFSVSKSNAVIVVIIVTIEKCKTASTCRLIASYLAVVNDRNASRVIITIKCTSSVVCITQATDQLQGVADIRNIISHYIIIMHITTEVYV